MTGESPGPTDPGAAPPAEETAACEGPSPQETVPPSEAVSSVLRTGPWVPADAGQAAAPVPPRIAGRYELGPEIARGGMGAVYRATDCVLGREVAVKLVRGDLVGTELAARFAEEARITARLQHPGIPSVHDLGQLPDGRPFLAMKLFRGRTLAVELTTRAAQLAAFEQLSNDPSVQGLALKDLWALYDSHREPLAEELRRLARIFEQVCQSVAFAHSQRVIHRDLKPANIMVAAFGEIQVMDWGLAKRLREPATAATGQGAAAQDPEPTPSNGDAGEADLTRPGAVMGTFAYMAPEQARAENEVVDARADVFALGAILCQILTGQPPYPGRTAREVWAQAAAGDLKTAAARLNQCGERDAFSDLLEVRLAQLAIRCLAPDPSERPAHAGEVAVAVTAALTHAVETTRQVELNQARTDAEMEYGKRPGRFVLGLKLVGMFVLLGMIWLFGYTYRAMTVAEAEWTAEKERQLKALQKAAAGTRPPLIPSRP